MVGGMDTTLFPRRVWRDAVVPGLDALAVVAGGSAVPGTFAVRRGIHPQMRLHVTAR